MTRRRLGVVALLGAVLAAGAASAQAVAGPQAHVRAKARTQHFMLGLMDDALFSNPALRPKAFDYVANLGPQVIRFDADWPAIARRRPANALDPADPAYDFSTVDDVVRRASSYGIPVLLTIVHTPPWAGGTAKHNHAPARMSDLQSFSYAIARRYSGRYTPPGADTPLPAVTRWEAWNEPNTWTHLAPQFTCKFCGSRAKPVSPATYAKILTAIYRGVHAAGKAASITETVAGGATRPGGSGPDSVEPSIQPLTFLSLFSKYHPPLDAYSHHPYRIPGFIRRTGASDGNIMFSDLPRLLKALDKAFPGKHLHLWLTEYALQTNPPDKAIGVRPGIQAATLRANYQAALRNPRIDMMVWFLINDEKAGPPPAYRGFQSGLAYVTGVHKPAWAVFRSLTGGNLVPITASTSTSGTDTTGTSTTSTTTTGY